MPCSGGAAVAVVTAERSKGAAGPGGVGLGCAQMPSWPRGPACLSDAVCGGPGGDWAWGVAGGAGRRPGGLAPGRDGTWNRPRAARLPVGACHSCPRAGGQPALEGHHAMATDGRGGAARSRGRRPLCVL